MSSASRFWIYTLNNPTFLPTEADFGKYFRYHVCQEELGENGTPHIQGYFELTRGVRLAAVKKMIPGAHFEVRRGTAQEAIDYCTKEDTRQAGPYHEGTPSGGQGKRSDIKDAYAALRAGKSDLEILEEHTEFFIKYQRGYTAARLLLQTKRTWKTEVWYIYGPPGLGKSKLAASQAPTAYYKPANDPWWDGYSGEADVILDDFTSGWFKWANLLQLLDRYALRVPVKGGFTSFTAKRLYITSNTRPWDLYGSKHADGTPKHPIGAFLRRIDHYIEFTALDVYTDHGSLDSANTATLANLLNQ